MVRLWSSPARRNGLFKPSARRAAECERERREDCRRAARADRGRWGRRGTRPPARGARVGAPTATAEPPAAISRPLRKSRARCSCEGIAAIGRFPRRRRVGVTAPGLRNSRASSIAGPWAGQAPGAFPLCETVFSSGAKESKCELSPPPGKKRRGSDYRRMTPGFCSDRRSCAARPRGRLGEASDEKDEARRRRKHCHPLS